MPAPKRARDEAFIARLQQLVDEQTAGNRAAFERMAELGEKLIVKYLSGTEPTRPVLNRIAAKCNVSIEWLATGEGIKAGVDAKERARLLNQELLATIIEALEEGLRQAGREQTSRQKAETVAHFYMMYLGQPKAASKGKIIALVRALA